MALNGWRIPAAYALFIGAAAVQPHVGIPGSLRGAADPPVAAVQIAFKYVKQTEKTSTFFDLFTIIYWGTVLTGMAVIVMVACVYQRQRDLEHPDELSKRQEEDEDEDDAIELQEDMWSFNLVVALGQAQFASGAKVPPSVVAVLSALMGLLQMFTIFLIVHDIDPSAEPITSVPSSPWKKTTWTVNSMKWIMVVFLNMGLVREVHDCSVVLAETYKLDPARLSVPKALPSIMTICHYVVTLSVIWGGVNAICSFNATPDIVYSSLAINFLANIDDMFYQFFHQMLDLKSNFKIVSKKGERCHVPLSFAVSMKMMLLLPIFWGMFLMGRAWHTNIMPNSEIHLLKERLQ